MQLSTDTHIPTHAMTDNEKEELKYDIAHGMLSRMSYGSVFQYALDRMLQMIDLYDDQQLETARKEFVSKKKSKDKSTSKIGFK